MAKFRIFKYSKAQANFWGGEAGGDSFQSDVLTDTKKIALMTSSYTPNLDTHETFNDITNEISGTGYTAGGATLASKTITVTPANSWGVARANSTAYVVGDVVIPATPNGHLYRCVVAGTSAGSIPTYPTAALNSVVDGSVTWLEIGRSITVYDCADPSWTTATFTARYGVIYRSTGTPSTSPLFYLIEFLLDDGVTPADVSVSASTFALQLHALGLFPEFAVAA